MKEKTFTKAEVEASAPPSAFLNSSLTAQNCQGVEFDEFTSSSGREFVKFQFLSSEGNMSLLLKRSEFIGAFRSAMKKSGKSQFKLTFDKVKFDIQKGQIILS